MTPTPSPIPNNLANLDWYPGHLAWITSMGLTTHHDPGAAVPARADLSGADMRDADLRNADLSGADLTDADLNGADLTDADLGFTDMRFAVLRDADLTNTNLTGARRHPVNRVIPGWSVVDGRLVRVA